jgi:replicative DNA helicase
MTGGFQPGDLIVIAARPSMGKTALSLNIAYNAAYKSKVPSAIFSLEMSKEQLLHRLMGSAGNINVTRLRNAKMEHEEWGRFNVVAGELEDVPIYINDTSALTALELRAQARRLKATEDIGMIIVDYLQLMEDPKARSREQEVSKISRSLKALAKELHLPVVALSQLNRKVEERTNKRPQLADLRDSGSIEQDSDLILFIYRDEVYREDSPDKGVAEINVAKQRMGPTGKFKLTFQADYSRFRDYIEDLGY